MALIIDDRDPFEAISYATVAYADEYFSYDLHASKWFDTEIAIKEKALVTATRQIDTLNFIGIQADPEQTLAFPRITARVRQLTDHQLITYGEQIKQLKATIPVDIKRAACEQALYLLQKQESSFDFEDLQAQNVTSYTVGDVSVSFNTAKTNTLVSLTNRAQQLVAPFIKRYTRLI